jgi:hypothetical protein
MATCQAVTAITFTRELISNPSPSALSFPRAFMCGAGSNPFRQGCPDPVQHWQPRILPSVVDARGRRHSSLRADPDYKHPLLSLTAD